VATRNRCPKRMHAQSERPEAGWLRELARGEREAREAGAVAAAKAEAAAAEEAAAKEEAVAAAAAVAVGRSVGRGGPEAEGR